MRKVYQRIVYSGKTQKLDIDLAFFDKDKPRAINYLQPPQPCPCNARNNGEEDGDQILYCPACGKDENFVVSGSGKRASCLECGYEQKPASFYDEYEA